MKRRELITHIAGTFTTLSLSPAFADIVASYAGAGANQADPGQIPGSILDRSQLSLLAALVDCVIPATDTPGAVAAGVPAFIDYLLGHWYAQDEQARFKSGLAALETELLRRSGEPFGDGAYAQQVQLLTALEQEHRQADPCSDAAGFVVWMKELTVLGYYSSEIGATRELNYLPIPGPYAGCIEFAGVGRTWAL